MRSDIDLYFFKKNDYLEMCSFFWQAQNVGVWSPESATRTTGIDSMMIYGHATMEQSVDTSLRSP